MATLSFMQERRGQPSRGSRTFACRRCAGATQRVGGSHHWSLTHIAGILILCSTPSTAQLGSCTMPAAALSSVSASVRAQQHGAGCTCCRRSAGRSLRAPAARRTVAVRAGERAKPWGRARGSVGGTRPSRLRPLSGPQTPLGRDLWPQKQRIVAGAAFCSCAAAAPPPLHIPVSHAHRPSSPLPLQPPTTACLMPR